MNGIPTLVRLVHTFAPGPLQEDVARIIAAGAFEPAGDGTGQHRDWTSITLYPTHAQTARSRHRLIESELLQVAPAIHCALASLRCSIQRVRLQSLGPGGVIEKHSDSLLGFSAGLIRVHIPVVTNPEVRFYIDGQRCVWQPGELWYGDFSKPHQGDNGGSQIRRHLVVDVYVDDLTPTLFPPELRPRICELMQLEMRDAQCAAEDQFACQFRVPAGLDLPGVVLSQAVLAQISRIGNQFMLLINHEPKLKLQPLTTSTLAILGLGTPAVVRVDRKDGKISTATLSLLSLHRELPLEILGASTAQSCCQTSSTVTAVRHTG